MTTPRNLGAAGRALWKEVAAKFELDPDDAALLEQACRTADELDTLSAAARTADPMVEGSKRQPVVNPVYEEVRRHRVVLARLLKDLALPEDEADSKPRDAQAAWRSARARKAAETRWDMRRKGA